MDNAHSIALSIAINLRYQTLVSIENEPQCLIAKLNEAYREDEDMKEGE